METVLVVVMAVYVSKLEVFFPVFPTGQEHHQSPKPEDTCQEGEKGGRKFVKTSFVCCPVMKSWEEQCLSPEELTAALPRKELLLKWKHNYSQ